MHDKNGIRHTDIVQFFWTFFCEIFFDNLSCGYTYPPVRGPGSGGTILKYCSYLLLVV